jgi:hypothetical protein
MGARNITEQVVYRIRDYLRQEMPGALARVRADRSDAAVNTEVPKAYFVYSPTQAFQTPAVVIVIDDVDMTLEKGQNFISCEQTGMISFTVEERDLERLQRKAWRYQDAGFEVIDRYVADGADYKFTVRVEKMRFSEDFTMKGDSNTQSIFRKEVVLDIRVFHFQQE